MESAKKLIINQVRVAQATNVLLGYRIRQSVGYNYCKKWPQMTKKSDSHFRYSSKQIKTKIQRGMNALDIIL